MRVFIVGATGGVGHRVAQRLRASGHAITAVVRRQSRPRAAYNRGSLRSVEALAEAMQGGDAVLFTAGA